MQPAAAQHHLAQPSPSHTLNVRTLTPLRVLTPFNLHSPILSPSTHKPIINSIPKPALYLTNVTSSHAHHVCDKMPKRDPNARVPLLIAHVRHKRFSAAIALFRELCFSHKPDAYSVSIVLRCLASLRAIRLGKEIQGYIFRNLYDNDMIPNSSILNFYGKCGLLDDARKVFDHMPERDVVSWTIMIMSYAKKPGSEHEMLGLFKEMLSCDVEPNQQTISVVLGCGQLVLGKQLHALAVKSKWELDAFVGSALVDMYAKSRNLRSAHLVFNRIGKKDVVCYNSLISGYGRTWHSYSVVCVFEEMGLAGVMANQSTYVGLLNGCANVGSMRLGDQLHAQVIASGNECDVLIQGVLVDMYAKCGNLDAARILFDRIPAEKNVVAWNSMIGGYGKHGYGKEALRVFNAMEAASICPDYITFTCLLSACSHSGMVEEGLRLFNSMGEVYGIPAQNEHYCCMVDLWGRAGMTKRAYEFICAMPCVAGASVWGALLGACKVWGDAELGQIAARRLFEMEPNCSGSYIALSNIFAARGQWDDVVMIRKLMDGRGINKDPGFSFIEIDNQMHEFHAGTTMQHPRIVDIHLICRMLNSSISDPLLSEYTKNDAP